jgi:hypothetical protein
VRYLSGLIALINEQMGAESATGQAQFTSAVEAHYRNTLGKTTLKLSKNKNTNIMLVY